MSLISPELWQFTFGDKIPMPTNCTYWQFAAAREILWEHEDMDWTKDYIKQLKHLKTLPHLADHIEELDELINAEMEHLA